MWHFADFTARTRTSRSPGAPPSHDDQGKGGALVCNHPRIQHETNTTLPVVAFRFTFFCFLTRRLPAV